MELAFCVYTLCGNESPPTAVHVCERAQQQNDKVMFPYLAT